LRVAARSGKPSHVGNQLNPAGLEQGEKIGR
jgi:hypothetical protein